MWVSAILKFATAPVSEMNFLCFRILDRPGLNFKAIKLTILQMVYLIEGYKLCKFQIDILQIEARTSLFVPLKILPHFYEDSQY